MEAGYLDLARNAIVTGLMLTVPILGVSLIVGLVISIFQAVTSIQEQTLTFVPKIVITGLALIFFGPWMMNIMYAFSESIFGHLHEFVK
jgi:flagellar biosynthetic protein FliQ